MLNHLPAYTRQWMGSALVQVMACCQLDSWEQMQWNDFHSRKCIWKWNLWGVGVNLWRRIRQKSNKRDILIRRWTNPPHVSHKELMHIYVNGALWDLCSALWDLWDGSIRLSLVSISGHLYLDLKQVQVLASDDSPRNKNTSLWNNHSKTSRTKSAYHGRYCR